MADPAAGGLVYVATYRTVTGDTTTPSAQVETALDDALTLIQERLNGRVLPHGTYTETLRLSRSGVVYPGASPVVSVSDPSVAASSIQGAGVYVGLFDSLPLTDWSATIPPQVTMTYVGGYTIDGASGTTKLPTTLRNAICRAAYNVLHLSPLVGVPAGATSVHVGDAGFSGKTLRSLDPLDDGILRDIHGYRRQSVVG